MRPPSQLRRSWLYVPAIKKKWYSRLAELDADVFVLDLEDSIAPTNKDEARNTLLQIGAQTAALRETLSFVRINCFQSAEFGEDIEAILEMHSWLRGVVLPKVSDATEVEEVDAKLAKTDLEIVPIIETLAGEQNVAKIINASQRIASVQWGESADYSRDYGRFPTPLDARSDPIALDFAIKTLKHCRLAGKQVMDGLFLDYKDANGLARRCQWAFDMGFEGKVAIHPDQLAIINRAFTPDRATFEQAKEIVATYESHIREGIVPYGDSFIHPPRYLSAKRFLEKYARYFDDDTK